MRKFLILIKVVLTKKNDRGFVRHKLNPFNPLTYVVFVMGLLLAVICFGVVGMWKEFELTNPFKYK